MPDQTGDLTTRFISHLHKAGAHRFTQNLTGKKTITVWSRVDEPLKLPPLTGDENLFYSVNPVTVRVIAKDRLKYPGKSDAYIERRVASKNETIAALNCLYAEFDGKDETAPTPEAIEAEYTALRADPAKEKAGEKALRNEARGKAKAALYKTDPEKYLAMAVDRVAALDPKPSTIIASGGGFQCFWLLDQPFILATDADRARAIDAQKRWVQRMGGDPGVCDIRRILRLPGSINHKKAYAPNYPTVSFVRCDLDLLYTFDELTALLPEPQAKTEPKARTAKPQGHHRAPSTTTEATEAAPVDNDRLIDLFNRLIDIRDILRAFGYTDHGDRMSTPGDPDSRGVQFNGFNKSYHHDTNDALYNEHLISPFDVLVTFQFNGNFSAALSALANAVYQPLRDLVHRQAPTEHRSEINDRKVVLAVLDIMQKTNRIGVQISKRRGANLAGIGVTTWDRSLARLSEFFTVEANQYGNYIAFNNVVFPKWITLAFLYEVSDRSGDPLRENDVFTQEKNSDPFVTGISKAVKRRVQRVADALEISHKQAKQDYTLPSAGAGVLLAYDTFLRIGDMTAQEYADATGVKKKVAYAHLRKAEKMGLADSERDGSRAPKVYSFIPDFMDRINELLPNMRTYTTGSQRENQRLERSQIWAQRGLKHSTDPEQKQRLERRFAKLARLRIPHLQAIYADLNLTDQQITDLAYRITDADPVVAEQVKEARRTERTEHRDNVIEAINAVAEHTSVSKTPDQVKTEMTIFLAYNAHIPARYITEATDSPKAYSVAVKRGAKADLQSALNRLRDAGNSDYEARYLLFAQGYNADAIDLMLGYTVAKAAPDNKKPIEQVALPDPITQPAQVGLFME